MKKLPVVFIAGSGHCGSTLLDMLLSAHPAMVGVGEMHNLEEGRKCACGETVETCSFWSNVFDEELPKLSVHRRKVDVLLGRDRFIHSATGEDIDRSAFIRQHEVIYADILARADADIVVDSSKKPARVRALMYSDIIEPYIIHLVRDGRAVTWSYRKKYGKALPYMWKWFATNLKTELVARRTGVSTLRVRYRDLARRPEQTLRSITGWLGLAYDPAMLQFRDSEQHQIGGNRMRMRDSDDIREDVSWRDNLPFMDRFTFTLLLGWMNYWYDL